VAEPTKPSILVTIGKGTGVEHESETAAKLFQMAFPDREVVTEPSPGVGYAITWHPPLGLLAQCENLQAIFSLGAGVDHVLRDPDLPDVPLVRFVDPTLTSRMVEWVVWQVFNHQRRAAQYAQLQHEGTWKELTSPPAEDLAIGIMGFGKLGQAAAKALLPFGFKINAWSRSGRTMDGVTAYDAEGLDAFLAATNIAVSLLPATAETKGIINTDLIGKLKKRGPLGGPVVLNAGRGDSQVSADIDAALRDGRLGGASLDVFETEPLPADNPLWTAPNCIITPHAAAVTDPRALAMYIRRQVDAVEAGKELENVVDRGRGY
jgi:glyoxylate/hydroxypyruvate reductase A